MVELRLEALRRLRALLRSRTLFRNWLSLGFKYYLMKRGLIDRGNLVARCRGGELAVKPEVYAAIVNAYHDGLIRGVDCKGYVLDRSGASIPLSWLWLLYCVGCGTSLGFGFIGDHLGVNWGGHTVKFPPGAAPFIEDILCENMLGDAYGDLDVRNRVVVDVGAGVGDTAVMFALMGAGKVIALEPHPSLFKVARETVEINGVADRVLLLNAGIGASDCVVEVGDCPVGYRLFSPCECKGDVKVRVYTLGSLVGEFGIDDVVLKMDCEGCEYDAVTDPEVLKVFRQVVIEYHRGYGKLVEILERAGFKTTIKPVKSVKVPVEKQGYIVGVT
ncbi:MAG: FkbM family methyltransferase [Infirmifilum sp.]